MPPDGQYDPNSLNAVLSRLELGLSGCNSSLSAFREEFKVADRRLHGRLDSHEKDLVDLKEAEATRTKIVKWSVAAIAVVGWAINAVISWKRGS
jgi:hypothetical protein